MKSRACIIQKVESRIWPGQKSRRNWKRMEHLAANMVGALVISAR